MTTRARPRPPAAPDRRAALRQYRRRAATYDFELAPFEAARRRAVARLALRPGQTVLDLGCGTGLSFDLLRRAVGPGGRIVGIEQSPEMTERARRRVADSGWHNVELCQTPLASAPLPPLADAALMHFTHDLMRDPEPLRRVLSRVRPGGRIVASGLKWTPWPLRNLLVLGAALHSVTTLAGLDAPWRSLEPWLGEPELETMFGGMVYLARWRLPG